MKIAQAEVNNEIKALYEEMILRYGAGFTDEILKEYTNIDVDALQLEMAA